MATGTKLQKARSLAKKLYKDKKRLSGADLYDHVEKVLNNLTRIGVRDEETLILAILHHAGALITPETKDELINELGEDIYNLVLKYTELRNHQVRMISEESINTGYIVQTYLNIAQDIRLLLVRLADKVEDAQSLLYLPEDVRYGRAQRILTLYSPVCHILGISTYARVLEDNAFKILNPQKYSELSYFIESKRDAIEKLFEDTEVFIRQILAENGMTNPTILKRIKHTYSVYKKEVKYNMKGRSLEHIYDIAAMSIIVDTVDQCYLVEDMLNNIWDSLPESRDDYIKSPRVTGYKSIHSIYKASSDFFLEIQIKTKSMHEENEYGNANHAFYKIGEHLKKYLHNTPDLLKQLNVKTLTRAQNTEISTFKNKVYVFTPKGKIVELPVGATVVDFAFAVHEDIGYRCISGLINGKIAKLTHELKDGDVIEVLTSPKAKPSKDWVDHVKSPKARRLIKKYLSEHEL